jgi:hypothetical protein
MFDDQGQVCTFYTVRWEDASLSETDTFFLKYENDSTLQRPLQELASFISNKIGDEKGALEDYFRFENAAQALPPTGTYQARIKWKTFLSISAISPFACIACGFQKRWWCCLTEARKQPILHKEEKQVWYFRKPTFLPNAYWTH